MYPDTYCLVLKNLPDTAGMWMTDAQKGAREQLMNSLTVLTADGDCSKFLSDRMMCLICMLFLFVVVGCLHATLLLGVARGERAMATLKIHNIPILSAVELAKCMSPFPLTLSLMR